MPDCRREIGADVNTDDEPSIAELLLTPFTSSGSLILKLCRVVKLLGSCVRAFAADTLLGVCHELRGLCGLDVVMRSVDAMCAEI